MSAPPVALTIAGSDCSAGAGIQADLKTFSLLGVHGLTAMTAIVSETPREVRDIHPLPPALLRRQVDILLQAYPVASVKTGLLGTAEHVAVVAELLEGSGIPLVVDPVLSSSTGTQFASDKVLSAYREQLLPLASLLTPNLPEAQRLLGDRVDPELSDEQIPLDAAGRLSRKAGTPVLLTGGHNSRNSHQATDILYDNGKITSFSGPWIDLPSTHGTGCTYSAAITGFLARGVELHNAIAKAKSLITCSLKTSYKWPEDTEQLELRALNLLSPEERK